MTTSSLSRVEVHKGYAVLMEFKGEGWGMFPGRLNHREIVIWYQELMAIWLTIVRVIDPLPT